MPSTYTPFRYPGGKSKIYNFIWHTLRLNNLTDTYIEPFAGGAGLAIKLLLKNKVNNVWINDYDKSIYSVWNAIINNHSELISLIKNVPFDYRTGNSIPLNKCIKYWYHIKNMYVSNREYPNSIKNAFSTLFLNRTNISGIISGGPIGGYLQNKSNKIYARFNKRTLIKKINRIYLYRSRIKLTKYNAFKMIPNIYKYFNINNTFVFVDPPYFKQGNKLYMSSFNTKDHKLFSRLMLNQKRMKWIITYDISKHILHYYKDSPQKYKYLISYSANFKNRGKFFEYMFANNNLKLESYKNVILHCI